MYIHLLLQRCPITVGAPPAYRLSLLVLLVSLAYIFTFSYGELVI
jgi:hypothetical protein